MQRRSPGPGRPSPVLLAVTLAALLGARAAAQTVLIDEPFNGPGLPAGYTVLAGSAAVSGGVLQLNSGGIQLPGSYSRGTGLVVEADFSIQNASMGDFNIIAFYDQITGDSTIQDGYSVGLYPNGGDNTQDLLWVIHGGAGTLLASRPTALSGGAWHHARLEILPSGALKVLVDGTEVLSATDGTIGSGKLTLRSWQLVLIDNVKVSTLAAAPVGVVGRYALDEGSGTTAHDSSGAGHDGTVSGASWVPGRPGSGSALSFRQQSLDAVDLPQSLTSGLGSTAYVEAWVRPTGARTEAGQGLIVFRKRAAFNDWQMYLVGPSNQLVCDLAGLVSGARTAVGASGGSVPVGSWSKVACWYDGTTMHGTVNGIEVASQTLAMTLDWPGAYIQTQIGNCTYDGGNASFLGDIDDVLVSGSPPSSDPVTCSVTCDASAPPSADPGVAVVFAGQALPAGCNGAATYSWAFGDGQTSTQQSPSHPYASAGTYGWTFTASAGGTTCTRSGSITVASPCSVTCSASAPAIAVAGTAASFTGSVTPTSCTGTPSHAWAFGDGGTSTAQSPSYTYPAAGTYTWTYTTSVDGKTCSKSGSVTVAPPCTVTCDASAPANGKPGDSLAFQASASGQDCSGTPSYAWNFGDGTSGTGASTSHGYASVGSFGWSVTVTVGSTACTRSGTVVVSLPPCTVDCSASVPSSVQVSVPAPFQVSAVPSSCTGAPMYAWSFGDGSTSTEQNPSHAYGNVGSHAWSVTTTVAGVSCTRSGSITVTETPVCMLACSADVPKVTGVGAPTPLSVSVTASSCSDPTTYAWAFGDGTTGTGESVTHVYPAVGTYTWTVTATSGATSCSKSATIDVTAGCSLTCGATVPAAAQPGSRVAFEGSAVASSCQRSPSYLWSFGDGGTADTASATHAYPSSGVYTWQLTVSADGKSCVRTGTIAVSTCALSCTASVPLAAGIGAAVPFVGSSTPAGCSGEPSYRWEFGDGGTAGSASAGHAYAASGNYSWTFTVTQGGAVCTKTGSLAVASSGCVKPAQPRITSAPGAPVPAGNPVTLAWSAVLPPGDTFGIYRVGVSTSPDCSSPRAYPTADTSLTIPTPATGAARYCVFVQALTGDGCPSDRSESVAFDVVVPAPAFVVIQPQTPAGIAEVDKAPPPATVVFRNIGGSAAALSLQMLRGLATPSPVRFPDVPAGQSVTAALQFDPLLTATPGFHADALLGSWNDGTSTKSVATAVTMTVLAAPVTGSSHGSRLSLLDSSEEHFIRQGGSAPPIKVIHVRNGGERPVRVAPSIGPGGAWLAVTGDFSTALSPGESRAYQLSVDRTRRTTADGDPPISTMVTFNSVDGEPADATTLTVFDEEPDAPTPGANRPPLASGQTSLVLGSVVSLLRADATSYLSDGWIRNKGSSPAAVDLYYTPDGQDGLSGADVKKASLSLKPYATYRLADFVRGLFTTSGSGQVELRSPALAQLSVRTTADSISRTAGSLVRYGAEIPTIRSGEGASLATGPLTLAGILGGKGSGSYTNVLLAETSGKPLDVLVSLRGPGGDSLGDKRVSVPAYGKRQLTGPSEPGLFPADVNYDGGSLEVLPLSGGGSVAAFATVLDAVSRAYTTRLGRFTAVSAQALRAMGVAAEAIPSSLVVPTVVHSSGANDSFFTTTLAIANGTNSPATLDVTYHPDGGAPLGPQRVTIPARQGRKYDDVVATLFGRRENGAGILRVEGDDLVKVVVTTDTSTPLDLADPGKGRSPSTLDAYTAASAQVVGSSDGKAPSLVISHPALEETSRFRTNLILAEVTGKPVTVRVRVVPRGAGGVPLAEQTLSLDGYQRKQVDRFIKRLSGVDVASAEQFTDVETIVEGVSGAGGVVALATKIDNDPASKRMDIYVLGPSGTAQGGIGIAR